MELGTLAVGVLAGIVIGALIFTPTGRTVSSAAARRAAYHMEPKRKR